MPLGIGAGGIVGVAFETTPGTYVAPTKFFPIRSEGLAWKQSTVWRRVIRGTVDVLGGVAGNGEFTGDIDMEFLEDVHMYFAYCSRCAITKTGTTNYTYDIVGAHSGAQATPKTMSITIVRNGIVFGYTNCVVGAQEFSIDNGLLVCKYSIFGSDEAVQSSPTPTYTTTAPFGAGMYDVQIPTASTVLDADGFSLTIDDSGENQYRLRNTGRGPQFAKFGERNVSLKLERDFQNRTEYDAFKALTAQSITIVASKGANNSVTFLLPVAIKDTYEVALSGVGDLVRASVDYFGTHDASTGASYKLTVKTQENIT